ncbi:MAG: RcnB family protein [Pseudomonadota bacterium]
MRSVLKTAFLASALVAAAPAVAQVSYNQPGIPAPGSMRGVVSANPPHFNPPTARVSPNPPYRTPPRMNGQRGGQRWGGNINGRWHGGMQAPGGWGAYRRPSRGHQLDRYWMSSTFQIPDYYSFGLGTPPNGYSWVRYYDDAVMVDSYGRVRDSVSGVAWADASADAGGGYAAASAAASAGAGYGQRGPIQTVDPNGGYYEDDQGYGDQGYGDDIRYPEPRGGYAPPVEMGPPAVHVRCPNQCPPQGYGYGSQGYSGSSYAGGGYYGGGATTTTVVIQYAPVVTTTTTTIEEEVIEESSASYETTTVSRPRTKRIYRAAPARRSTKRLRRTGCGC